MKLNNTSWLFLFLFSLQCIIGLFCKKKKGKKKAYLVITRSMQFVRRDKSYSRENLSCCPVYRIYAGNIRYVICVSLLRTGSLRKIKSFISSANSRGLSQTRSDRWESGERAKVTIAVKSSDEAQC